MPDHLPRLQQYAGALRRLAVRLLDGDAERAEDAVQETWLRAACTSRRSTDLVRPRAWLEQILRNVTRQSGRDEARRRRREAEAARHEAYESAGWLAERREAFAVLSRAVSALPPEQQDVVLARYFEDLPPREIARRLGLPVELVYSRLDQARRRLRRDLGQDLGDDGWRRSLCILVASPGGPPTVAPVGSAATAPAGTRLVVTTATAILMTKIKFIVSAGAIALAGVLALQFAGAETPSLRAESGSTGVPDPAPLRATGSTPGPRVERTRPADIEASEEVGDAPVFELEVRVVNADGVPARHHSFVIAPVGEDLNRWYTGEDGVVVLRWLGRVPTMRVQLSPDGYAHERLGLSVHELRAGIRTSLTLRTVQRCPDNRYPAPAPGVATLSGTPGQVLAPAPVLRLDENGFAHFVTRRIEADAPAVVEPDVGVRLVYGGRLAMDDGGSALLIEGTVRCPDGRPAADATVLAGPDPENGAYTASTRTGPDGRYVLEVRGDDPVVLRFGGGDFGVAHAELVPASVPRGGPRPVVDALLDRGHEFVGSVVGADGHGLPGMRVEIRPTGDPNVVGGGETDDHGRFAIPNVADVPFDVMVFAPDSAIPCTISRGLRTGQGLTIRLEREIGAVEVRMPTSDGAEQFEMLWIDATSGCAQIVRRPLTAEAGTPMAPVPLPVGSYELFAAGRVSGWSLQGQLHVSSGSDGPLPFIGGGLEPPGRLVRSRTGSGWSCGVELPILRLADAVVVEAGTLPRNRPGLTLPAGRYRILGQDGTAHEVTVRPGEEIELAEPDAGG